ncbi:MAG: HAMP domain-containing sensor histidine kinase [Salegentibacter sp.]
MNIKKGYLLIFIISVVGLAVVQYQYLRIGLNLAEVQFSQKMGKAIGEIKDGLRDQNELTFLAGTAITSNEENFKLSLDSVQDAARFFMDDFLKEKLLQNGIRNDFSYALYGRDSTEYLHSPTEFEQDNELLKYPFSIEGYLPELAKKNLILELQFEDINHYFFTQLNGLTIPSLIFIVAIILVVVWVLRSFYWQRNIITVTNEFINNLTHELKTPVFSIGIATKILDEKVNDDGKQVVGIIRDQVEKLKSQIDKVLELASIEGKKNLFKKREIDFKPILLDIAKEFREISFLENFDFESEIRGEKYLLYCEPYHLENAINSILDNAKKYSGDRPSIKMEAFPGKDRLQINISDNGIGIRKEDRKRIFEKFYRVSSGDLHDVKGYGIGLNYVQQVIRNHKGRISLSSTPGEGSVFTISLPLK